MGAKGLHIVVSAMMKMTKGGDSNPTQPSISQGET